MVSGSTGLIIARAYRGVFGRHTGRPGRLTQLISRYSVRSTEVYQASGVGVADEPGPVRRSVACMVKVAGWGVSGAAEHAMYNPQEACQRALLLSSGPNPVGRGQ